MCVFYVDLKDQTYGYYTELIWDDNPPRDYPVPKMFEDWHLENLAPLKKSTFLFKAGLSPFFQLRRPLRLLINMPCMQMEPFITFCF